MAQYSVVWYDIVQSGVKWYSIVQWVTGQTQSVIGNGVIPGW